MIKDMLKTAGVDNMEDFYKLHPTEEHFFKTYPHMKDKMKKRKTVRRRKYQPGGGVPFTDFAAAQAQGDQAAVDQINQQAAQQYLYKHPVYPTPTGAAPGAMTGTLPQVTITAPQQPFYYKSPKEVYQDFYQNVAPYYPMRSIAEYQQSYATTGMPPQYGNVDEAEKRWRDVQSLKNVSNEEYNAAYDNYRRALEGNHRHGDFYLSNINGTRETDADVYGASKVFNPSMQPYVGPKGTTGYNGFIDWDKVQQGLDTGNYNTDARRYTTMNGHTGYDKDAEQEAENRYNEEMMRYRNPKFKQTPGFFEQEEYQKGGTAGEGSQEMLQKIMQLAAQAFQQGHDPRQVLKVLIKQGIPEQTAMQIVQAVIRQDEDSDESQYGGKGEGMEYQEGMEEGTQEEYKKGGIHINPAKKGTFTAQATRMGMGVQEAARHILANKDRYSPGMVKKANFARNASKWKHAYGGPSDVYQPQGSTTNGQQYEIKAGVATPVPPRAYGGRAMNRYNYGTDNVTVGNRTYYEPNPYIAGAINNQQSNQPTQGSPVPVNTVNSYVKGTALMDTTGAYYYDPVKNTMTQAVYDPTQPNSTAFNVINNPNLTHFQTETGEAVDPRYMKTSGHGYYPVEQRAYGGRTLGKKYQEGGETMGQEQMEGAPQQAQEQAMGQEQQGGQEQMMQQLAQMVAQGLQQGMDPQQIIQMLVQQGVPQEVATQVVQMVMQQMQGGAPQGGPGQQYQPQGGQYQGPQGSQPQAAMGGYYANGGSFFNESYMPFDY